MKKYCLAIDQGTTGTTSMIFDVHEKKILGHINIEFKQFYPKSSWVEHDLNEIWSSVREAIEKLLLTYKISTNEIKCIGITNQRETTCAFNNEGDPLEKAIVWQDKRTSSFCESSKKDYEKFRKITGLPLDPYFSGSKMKWLLENSKNVSSALKNNSLKFGTIDTFLLYKLTSGNSFYTEPSNASRTLLYNLEKSTWDTELLKFFNIPRNTLPEILNTFDSFGKTENLDFLPDGIPITCLFGDQQSALFGQACINPGDLKCTYGTGGFLLLNTGEKIVHSNNGLLTTVAYKNKNKSVYALEGSTFIAGAAVQFFRDNLNIIDNSKEIEDFAKRSKEGDIKDLHFFPFFTGIGSPYWKPEAKACIYGMTRNTSKEDLSRACLEGISQSITDLVESFEADTATSISKIRVDGGASNNNFLMQLQSNFTKKSIIRPKIVETTAFGAIIGSLIGVGQIQLESINNFWEKDIEFSEKSSQYFIEKRAQWKNLTKKIFL